MLIREANINDIDGLHRLALKLNTVNLQPDRDLLTKQIEWSAKSFRGEAPQQDAEYLFVLEDAGELVGTSLIIAQHGTFERPAVYFKVRFAQKYSTSLKKHFRHQVLDLIFDYEGPTEIGGLIVDKQHKRLSKFGLGKPLSFARFLYIAMHRDQFRDEIVAELLPQLREDGKSDLWEALGQKFCGLDYFEADRRSRHDIEFILSLFPMFPIYTTLLDDKIQENIGVVGQKSKPAESLLARVGFYWDHTIDPFDGGPTYRVQTERCLAVRRTVQDTVVGYLDGDEENLFVALIAKNNDSRSDQYEPFKATLVEYQREKEGVLINKEGGELLNINRGDKIFFMPFSGENLIKF